MPHARPRRSPSLALATLLVALGCQASTETESRVVPDEETCRATQRNLARLVEALPEEGFAERGRPDLPTATLGGVLGDGLVLDVTPERVLLDGEPLEADSAEQRIALLRQRLAALLRQAEGSPSPAPSRVYVATSRETDVATLRRHLMAVPEGLALHLMFETPPTEPASSTRATQWSRWPARLWSTRDPTLRRELAQQAYAELTTCPAILEAASAPTPEGALRWPVLRAALLEAIPRCDCREVSSPELRQLVMAEQRAGAASLGSVPIDFVRDERCGASLPYSSAQRLLSDIEAFDEEFSGRYGTDAVNFEKVVTNERLLHYLCKALPGETLAALQRARHTLFWRVPGVEECQAWQFEPREPGSPMGTWRQIVADADEGLAVHYWQGAEEIRLFGPVGDPASKPTDPGRWACNQNFEMRLVDAQSIHLAQGRWFFEESACRSAPRAEAELSGCIAEVASGKIPPHAPTEPAHGPVPPQTETESTTETSRDGNAGPDPKTAR